MSPTDLHVAVPVLAVTQHFGDVPAVQLGYLVPPVAPLFEDRE